MGIFLAVVPDRALLRRAASTSWTTSDRFVSVGGGFSFASFRRLATATLDVPPRSRERSWNRARLNQLCSSSLGCERSHSPSSMISTWCPSGTSHAAVLRRSLRAVLRAAPLPAWPRPPLDPPPAPGPPAWPWPWLPRRCDRPRLPAACSSRRPAALAAPGRASRAPGGRQEGPPIPWWPCIPSQADAARVKAADGATSPRRMDRFPRPSRVSLSTPNENPFRRHPHPRSILGLVRTNPSIDRGPKDPPDRKEFLLPQPRNPPPRSFNPIPTKPKGAHKRRKRGKEGGGSNATRTCMRRKRHRCFVRAHRKAMDVARGVGKGWTRMG
eukprot:scaffold153_cov347-Pavlova_lutheri.AAC.60